MDLITINSYSFPIYLGTHHTKLNIIKLKNELQISATTSSSTKITMKISMHEFYNQALFYHLILCLHALKHPHATTHNMALSNK